MRFRSRNLHCYSTVYIVFKKHNASDSHGPEGYLQTAQLFTGVEAVDSSYNCNDPLLIIISDKCVIRKMMWN